MQSNLDLITILLESGLVVKFVLLLLIILSVLTWAIIINRKKTINLTLEADQKFLEFFVENKDLELIYDKIDNFEDSSLALVYKKGFLEFNKIRETLMLNSEENRLKEYIQSSGIQAIERSLKKGKNLCISRLEKRLSTLASISSVAPFVGLFGTVWGIIDSFTGLASGGGSLEAVAPGIAEALVATAVGLAAAIPASWAYNIFYNKISAMNSDMENFEQDFLNLIERKTLIG